DLGSAVDIAQPRLVDQRDHRRARGARDRRLCGLPPHALGIAEIPGLPRQVVRGESVVADLVPAQTLGDVAHVVVGDRTADRAVDRHARDVTPPRPDDEVRRPLDQRLGDAELHLGVEVVRGPPAPQELRRLVVPAENVPLGVQDLRQDVHRHLGERGSHLEHPNRWRQGDAQRVEAGRALVIALVLGDFTDACLSNQRIEAHTYTAQLPLFLRFSHSGDAVTARYTLRAPTTQTAASILLADFGDSFLMVKRPRTSCTRALPTWRETSQLPSWVKS